MGKRTYLEDIVSIALLYRKEYVGTDMITYDKIIEFDKVINDNLDNMNSNCFVNIKGSNYVSSDFFTKMTDEDGNKFAVILPSVDLEYAWKIHVGCLPVDVLIASQMDNALEIIGLEKRVDENNRIYFVQKDVEKYTSNKKRQLRK